MHVARKVDIGILTIREDEFRAALGAFRIKAGVYRGATREYTLRYADAGDGQRYTVAILHQLEQGNGEAQEAARDLWDDLRPRLILVVGIGGGFPPGDVTLGDVVISTRIHDFTVGARKYKEQPTYASAGGPITKEIAGVVANLAGKEDLLGDWTADLPTRPAVTWSRRLYGPKKWQDMLRDRLEEQYGEDTEDRDPIYMAGPVASSDQLVKDPKELFPWISTARNSLAIDMESGGVYRAARERCSMLAIRGISDIVGLKRSEAWTKFACASAAAFTRAFLRTRPIPTETPSVAAAPKFESEVLAERETLYTNLIPLVGYPPTIYVAPATAATYKQAWAKLREGAPGHVPRAWVLYNKHIYSFIDPDDSLLRRIVDRGAIEENPALDWAESPNPERIRLFVQLLRGALTDDLGKKGVWYFRDDDVFAFAGKTDEKERKYKYHGIKRTSTITVVKHYTSVSQADGRSFKQLRHLAFSGRFRQLAGEYYLQINPTYRFTHNGREKDRFHASALSGIKRWDRNRAVLNQTRLWNGVLAARPATRDVIQLLRFGTALSFDVEQKADEDMLVFWDVPAEPDEPMSEVADEDDLPELEVPRV